jgi:hypothetical protein
MMHARERACISIEVKNVNNDIQIADLPKGNIAVRAGSRRLAVTALTFPKNEPRAFAPRVAVPVYEGDDGDLGFREWCKINGVGVGCGAIRAELTGSNVCTALEVVAIASAPVLALCRKLVAAGIDPATPLEAWRGSTLCVRVRGIGEAAQLEPSPRGTGFVRRPGVRGGPPIAQTGGAFTGSPQRDGASL